MGFFDLIRGDVKTGKLGKGFHILSKTDKNSIRREVSVLRNDILYGKKDINDSKKELSWFIISKMRIRDPMLKVDLLKPGKSELFDNVQKYVDDQFSEKFMERKRELEMFRSGESSESFTEERNRLIEIIKKKNNELTSLKRELGATKKTAGNKEEFKEKLLKLEGRISTLEMEIQILDTDKRNLEVELEEAKRTSGTIGNTEDPLKKEPRKTASSSVKSEKTIGAPSEYYKDKIKQSNINWDDHGDMPMSHYAPVPKDVNASETDNDRKVSLQSIWNQAENAFKKEHADSGGED